jgi:hypothetical protein
VLALVRRARRRLFHNELFAQGANAASAALLTFILLLLLGAEILSWQLVIVVPAAAFAIGLYLARKRLATPYATAQMIDHRLGLVDTLSTALYFREAERAAHFDAGIVKLQAETAERVAASVDAQAAVPYRMPRTAYAMAALFLVAGSLFALRYGVSRRLDLKQPLATMLHQAFGSEKTQTAQAKPPKVPRPDIAPEGDMSAADEKEQRAGEAQESTDQPEDGNEAAPGKS